MKKNLKKAVIFLNGEPPVPSAVTADDFSEAFVICADGALSYARDYCRPDLVIGDFDSMPNGTDIDGLNCERYPVNKDRTDSQLAVLRAIELGYSELEIFGAFGGRIDHEYVNYSLLALADAHGATAVLKGGRFDVSFVTPSRPFVKSLKIGGTVSLVPYSSSVHILLTKGLRFCAKDVVVNNIDIFTTSNTVEEETVEYRLLSGAALLFTEN